VIETIPDMPPATLGFKATGKLTKQDYEEVLVPPIRDAVDRGEKLRVLFQLGPGWEGMEPAAVLEDLQASVRLGIGHWSAWEKTALVTDVDWLRRSMQILGWMMPGEVRAFELSQLQDAKPWLAGSAPGQAASSPGQAP
jgi:hypothetical protein